MCVAVDLVLAKKIIKWSRISIEQITITQYKNDKHTFVGFVEHIIISYALHRNKSDYERCGSKLSQLL